MKCPQEDFKRKFHSYFIATQLRFRYMKTEGVQSGTSFKLFLEELRTTSYYNFVQSPGFSYQLTAQFNLFGSYLAVA